MNMEEVTEEFKKIGISEQDAKVLADCVISRKSCSWVNNDPVDNSVLKGLNTLLNEKEYKIKVLVQAVPTRNKFIWEVKTV